MAYATKTQNQRVDSVAFRFDTVFIILGHCGTGAVGSKTFEKSLIPMRTSRRLSGVATVLAYEAHEIRLIPTTLNVASSEGFGSCCSERG